MEVKFKNTNTYTDLQACKLATVLKNKIHLLSLLHLLVIETR